MSAKLKYQKSIQAISTVLAFLVTFVVLIYATNLLLRGIAWTVVNETPLGGGEAHLVYTAAPQAFIPLVAGILLLAGLIGISKSRKLILLSWAGWVILAVFSGLFLFSIGGSLLPAAGILLIFLIAIQLSH